MEKNIKFIAYKDDDDSVKGKWVVVIEENDFGIKFHFQDGGQNITIPWTRILKIKEKGDCE